MFIITAVLFGLAGSFHCVGMCGPIAMALPLNNSGWYSKIGGGIVYNLGRSITYALMGAIFGLFGKGLMMGGFQQAVSILTGIVMIAMVVFPSVLHKKNTFIKLSPFLHKPMQKLFRSHTPFSLLFIGVLNGLLPCGLVYMALAAALATGGVYQGALFMFVFGMGTLPMMLAVNLVGNTLSGTIRTRVNKLIPVLVVFLGMLFILRGLDLGIPYISPPAEKLQITTTDNSSQKSCH